MPALCRSATVAVRPGAVIEIRSHPSPLCCHAVNRDMMKLRPANTDDLVPMFDIHRSVFRSHIDELWGWNEDWQRGNFASECAAADTSVVEIDGDIAGYIQILEREDEIYVQNIAISADAQGKGIGTMLLKSLQSRAETLKVPLQLEVFRSNKPAQRLYERLGFCNVGETRTHIELSWTGSHFSSRG